MKKIIQILFIASVLFGGSVSADNWKVMHEKIGGTAVNSGVFLNGFNHFVAVGDSGKVYHVRNGELAEIIIASGNADNLKEIAADNSSNMILMVGDNGTILSSQDSAETFTAYSYGAYDLSAVGISHYTEQPRYFIGGGDGVFAYADTLGSWHPVNLPVESLNISLILETGYSGFFVIGVKNDTTYILQQEDYQDFGITDTIPNIIINDAFYTFVNESEVVYFCGTDTSKTSSSIFNKVSDEGFGPINTIYQGLPGNAVSISGLFNELSYELSIWVAAEDGTIFKSLDNGDFWQTVYNNGSEVLNKLIANNEGFLYGDYAYTLGDNELFLKYGFNLDQAQPLQNTQLDDNLDSLALYFSSTPSIMGIDTAISLKSSLTGKVPTDIFYDLSDSTILNIRINRSGSSNLLPGEHLSFDITAPIKEIGAQNGKLFTAMRDYDVLSLMNSPIDYSPDILVRTPDYPSTNYVCGYFNNDYYLDLIHISNGSIFCYAGQDSGGFSISEISNLNIESVDTSMAVQLLKYDINNDGKLDLIYYTKDQIYLFANQSDTHFSFLQQGSYTDDNNQISAVLIDNINNNSLLDLRVMTSAGIYVLPDITFLSMPTEPSLIYYEQNLSSIDLGDINNDGYNDIAAGDIHSNFGIYKADESRNIGNNIYNKNIAGGPITEIKIADLNRNRMKEVVVINNQNIFIFDKQADSWSWNFFIRKINVTNDTLTGLLLQDFGGYTLDDKALMDIAVITKSGKLLIYENLGELNFSENPVVLSADIEPSGLLQGDFDGDDILNPVLFSQKTGDFEIFSKTEWKPTIKSARLTNRDEITLRWTSCPQGNLDYYEVIRDTTPQFNSSSDYHQTFTVFDDSSLIDYTRPDYFDYFYAVRAVYRDESRSDFSNIAAVEKTYKLDGALTGTLSRPDTLYKVYLVKDTVYVPEENSLTIEPGVTIVFNENSIFEVFGNLTVAGDPYGDGVNYAKSMPQPIAGDGMVNFIAASPDILWKGLFFLPAENDTVRIRGVNIRNAQYAIMGVNRPIQMEFGNISKNYNGFYAENNYLSLKNIICDSTYLGIVLSDSVTADIKNINILNAAKYGLIANDSNLDLHVNNSIFWNNNDSSIVIIDSEGDAENIAISYSTIDSIVGTQDTSHINKTRAPVFFSREYGLFVVDPSSPTIDAGDPKDDFSQEPQPNGGRINQGVWGGTSFAANSPEPDLIFEPQPAFLNAGANKQDTLTAALINRSEDNVTITEIFLKDTTVRVFSVPDLQSGMSIPAKDSIKFRIIFSPRKRGEYSDTLVVKTDSPHNSMLNYFINGHAPNTPPTVDPEHENFTLMAGDTLIYQIHAYDADGDTLHFAIDYNYSAEWLSISSEGVISGVPSPEDVGYNEINVIISDEMNDNCYFYAGIDVLRKGELLSGSVSGILDSTHSPYYVKDPIYLSASDTLLIEEGAELRFSPNAYFDVFGKLRIDGNFENMVEFTSMDHDSLWRGVKIASSSDSLKLNGLLIFGADTALNIESGNLYISQFAVFASRLALLADNNSLFIKNAYIDSNGVGMIIHKANTNLKNITLINSLLGGISVGQNANLTMSNTILWNNNHQSLVNAAPKQNCTLRYSTIDTIQGDYTEQELSRKPPVFFHPPDDDGPPSIVDPSSPTVDAGDPKDDFSQEPQPNGGRINQGAFGNTPYATRSLGAKIAFTPDTLKFQAYPSQEDTLVLTISNNGGSELRISSAYTAHHPAVFRILNKAPYTVSPMDTVRLTVRFKPRDRITYSDSLVFISNALGDTSYVPLVGYGLNHAPIVIGEAPKDIRVEHNYRYKIKTFDKDGDTPRFTPVQMPAWLSLSDSGIISGTPALADTGLNHVEIAIDDGYGGYADFITDIMVWIIDDYIPNITITSYPKKLLREAAAHFEFFADDTSGYLIGDTPEKLYKHYRLISLNGQEVLRDVDSLKDNSVTFYPLKDGKYLFTIWAYDSHGNGIEGVNNKEKFAFEVSTSKVTISRMRWHMIAFPRSQSFDLSKFSNDSSAVVLRWSNKEGGYIPPDNYQVTMGEGFWIQSRKSYNVDLTSYDQTSPEDSIYTAIEAGWNQVGIPLGYSVNWNEMIVMDSVGKRMPLSEALESDAVYWYVQDKKFQGYIWEKPDTAAAYPWRGYWIKSAVKGTLIFPKTPAVQNPADKDSIAAKHSYLAKYSVSNWRLNITLSNDSYLDDGNIIGISTRKNKSLVYEPPHFDNYCSLYFNDAKGRLTQNIKDDFENYEDVISWNLSIKSTQSGKRHLLKWNNEEINKLSLYIYLIDTETEQIISMNDETSYTFTPAAGVKSFRIYATQDESFTPQVIPFEFKLLQNYPNPFNPSTTIRFGVPESLKDQKVTVSVFDILGRKIATLLDEKMKPGYHEVKWNGTNESDVPSASGIYFYQIKSGNTVLVKKMVLMR